MRRIRNKVTYANVVASLALFLALGGVGYAATQLPKNSVGTKQLKSGAVTADKISKATRASLAAAGPTGAQGPAGPQGIPGAPGTPGEPGSARAYARVSTHGELDVAHSKGVIAVVPACQPSDPNECATPPESTEGSELEYCFKLDFEPNVALVTPVEGFTYNHTTPLADAEIPGRPYGDLRGGCPDGYRSASVRVSKESEGEPNYGFFVLFN